jgi:alpha-tubulin suppressor-like RCC1 family protein
LKRDGTVVAWGNNYGNVTNLPPGLTNIIQVSVCSLQALALRSDGTVICWGDGQGANRNPAISNVVSIAAGGGFNLALLSNGTVLTWGNSSPPSAVAPYLTNAVAIAASKSVALAILGNSYPQPFTLSNPQKNLDGTVSFNLLGAHAQHFTIQSSTNFTQWTFWQNSFGGLTPPSLTDQPPSVPTKFFRAVRMP